MQIWILDLGSWIEASPALFHTKLQKRQIQNASLILHNRVPNNIASLCHLNGGVCHVWEASQVSRINTLDIVLLLYVHCIISEFALAAPTTFLTVSTPHIQVLSDWATLIACWTMTMTMTMISMKACLGAA